jgi:hypothetical protein
MVHPGPGDYAARLRCLRGTIAPITAQDDKIGLLAWSTVSGSTSFMEPER